jgi:hypothetical protein
MNAAGIDSSPFKAWVLKSARKNMERRRGALSAPAKRLESAREVREPPRRAHAMRPYPRVCLAP